VKGGDKKANELLKSLEKARVGKDLRPDELDKIRADVREIMKTNQPDRKGRLGRGMVAEMDKFATTAPVTYPLPPGVQGPRAPAPQTVKTDLAEARQLNTMAEKNKLIEAAKAKSERRVTSGRFDPFTPSPESMTSKGFSKIEEKALEGSLKSKFTPEELDKIHNLYTGGPAWSIRNIGGKAEPYSFSGKADYALQKWLKPTMVVPAVAEVLSRAGQRATRNEIEDLGALIRDPLGRGVPMKGAPDVIAAAKDKLARLMTGITRTGIQEREKK
jgi:hypothetical protein